MKHSEFKKAAKIHQIKYREKNINSEKGDFPTYLSDMDAIDGKNFYDGFNIFYVVKRRYSNFNVGLYSDMLRSEHIPFNLFIPFKQDLEYCKKVFNQLLDGCIKSIDNQCTLIDEDNILIEFAPPPKEKYLNDRTSFDSYIEYTHIDNSKGILGIEVKYTEKEYKIEDDSTEAIAVNDKSSIYWDVSRESDIYYNWNDDELKDDIYRQIWRNQLLAEQIRLVHNDVFKHSSSLTFFPEGNGHFVETSDKYIEKLKDKKKKFIPVTYEKFIKICRNSSPNNEYDKWIDYLEKRYIFNNKNELIN